MNFRLFVALDPPDPVRRRLASIQADLRSRAGPHAGEVRWAAPEAIHLTLQFLGAVPEERLPALEEAVGAAAAASRPLMLEVKGAGGFPSARRPRVVWAGVEGDREALTALVADLGRRLAPLGFTQDERPFSPHLTLGRAREGRGAPGLGGALVQASSADAVPWRADALVLVRSHLSPAGARYEALRRFGLGPEPRA